MEILLKISLVEVSREIKKRKQRKQKRSRMNNLSNLKKVILSSTNMNKARLE